MNFLRYDSTSMLLLSEETVSLQVSKSRSQYLFKKNYIMATWRINQLWRA